MGRKGLKRRLGHYSRHNGGFRGMFSNRLPAKVDRMYVDANAMFYPIVESVFPSEGPERERVIKFLENGGKLQLDNKTYGIFCTQIITLVTRIKPRVYAGVFIDGVPPAAKIQQQRERQYIASLEATEEDIFNKGCIKPGTSWMWKLDEFYRTVLQATYAKIASSLGYHIEFIYSSHMCRGEAEHKFFDRVRSNSGVQVVYGEDADLTVLGLVSGVDNLYIVNGLDLTGKGEEKIASISIDNLRRGVSSFLRHDQARNPFREFALCTFLLGNDFIPPSPSMAYMDISLDSIMYALVNSRPIIDSDNILDWRALCDLLANLSTGGHITGDDELVQGDIRTRDICNMSEMARIEVIHSSRPVEERTSRVFDVAQRLASLIEYDIPFGRAYRSAWYSNALGHRYGKITVTNDMVFDMCVSYLRTMLWIYSYYISGQDSISWSWYYPYHYAPLLIDLHITLRKILDDEEGIEKYLVTPSPSPDDVPHYAYHQLIAITPIASSNIAPVELRWLWSTSHPWADLFVHGFMVAQDDSLPNKLNTSYPTPETEHVGYKWEDAVVLIPFSDMRRLTHHLKAEPMMQAAYNDVGETKIGKSQLVVEERYNTPLTSERLRRANRYTGL